MLRPILIKLAISLIFVLNFQQNIVAQSATPKFTLEDIYIHKKFQPKDIKGLSYINEKEYQTLETFESEQYSVVRVWDTETNSTKDIFDSRILKQLNPSKNCILNSYIQLDENRWIVAQQTEKIYRYSEKAYYYFVDLKSSTVVPLHPDNKQMYPSISPDGNWVAFVMNNDLYLRNLDKNALTRITKDGKAGNIINGASDWVYEEEFGMTSAFEWSPDGKSLAFLRFDESRVKQMTIDYFYGDYPEAYQFKYPRAGEENSVVSAHIYQLKKKKTIQVPVKDEYLPQISWRNDGALSIMHLPRFQNELYIDLYHPATSKISTLYKETSEQYVELPICFDFLSDGTLAISSEKNGWNHLYFIDKSGVERQITTGNYDINVVYQINEADKVVYFQAPVSGTEHLNIAAYHWDTHQLNVLSPAHGNASATFVTPYHYIERFSADTVRRQVSIVSIQQQTKNMLLDDRRAEDSILQPKIYLNLPVEGDSLHAYVIFPPNFDSTKTYPVLFNVYGGPGAQEVVNIWPGKAELWLQYVAQLGYIVVCADNRGTPNRGSVFKKANYLKLGKIDTEDQLSIARYVANEWKFVDSSRMGMFGWSYGGYMTLMCMMNGEGLFKAGISVAPVSHWRFYDAVYSERYMRTPAANSKNYDQSSPMLLAKKLQGDLLLIHGMADDNVHFQHSIELIKALNDVGKQYRFLAYPNKNHGIGTGSTSLHMFKAASDFLLEKL